MRATDRFENPSAPPGNHRKYAKPERERRFLLAVMPVGLEIAKTAHIHDRYIAGTRIRLRTMTETRASGVRTYYKLTQKVPAPDGGPGLLTTMYLTADEHERFAALPAATLEKTRTSMGPFGVDAFAGPLEGLFLAEAEFDSDEEMDAFAPPPFAIAEVTLDGRFTGGRFVTMTAADLRALVAEFGLH